MINPIIFSSNTTMTNSIMPTQNKSVTIEGKIYPVKKVPDYSIVKTFVPSYKEVVIINGKQYNVKSSSRGIIADKPSQVVVVNGKTYDINNGLMPSAESIFSYIADTVKNNNIKLNTMA